MKKRIIKKYVIESEPHILLYILNNTSWQVGQGYPAELERSPALTLLSPVYSPAVV